MMRVLFIVYHFLPPPPLTIAIIIDENDDDSRRPLRLQYQCSTSLKLESTSSKMSSITRKTNRSGKKPAIYLSPAVYIKQSCDQYFVTRIEWT